MIEFTSSKKVFGLNETMYQIFQQNLLPPISLNVSACKRFFSILRLGLDEAGRGAVLGPLVISAVLLETKDEDYLRSLGVKDSKQMSPEQRYNVYDMILEKKLRSCSVHITSLSIDKQRKSGLSMNRIEENHIFSLLQKFLEYQIDEVLIDAFVSKDNRLYKETCKIFPSSLVKCEHHADMTYTCVAAASVIAKVERDRAMEVLSEECGMNLGTGYPHDSASTNYIRQFAQEYGKAPVIARNSWITTQRILMEEKQKRK